MKVLAMPYYANPEYAEYLRRFGEIGCKRFHLIRITKCMKLSVIDSQNRGHTTSNYRRSGTSSGFAK
jgi:hypothetical protein